MSSLTWKRQPELFNFDSRRHRCKAKPPAYDGPLAAKEITPDKRADSVNEKWPENLACCHKRIYLNACAAHDSFPLNRQFPNLPQCSQNNGSKSRLTTRSSRIYCYFSYRTSIPSRVVVPIVPNSCPLAYFPTNSSSAGYFFVSLASRTRPRNQEHCQSRSIRPSRHLDWKETDKTVFVGEPARLPRPENFREPRTHTANVVRTS